MQGQSFLREQRRMSLECDGLGVKADLDAIPQEELVSMFVILNSSIRAYLATPEGKADYEAWKKERRKEL